MNIKDMVAKGQNVSFMCYSKGELWYQTDTGFEFPVPIEDTGDGIFLAKDKAIMFMRYIRKHLAYLEKSKQEQMLEQEKATKQAEWYLETAVL